MVGGAFSKRMSRKALKRGRAEGREGESLTSLEEIRKDLMDKVIVHLNLEDGVRGLLTVHK